MQILRLRVSGGFMDGLDLRFAPGLNTIVGARGTGKSTLVEFIRFALGLAYPDSSRRAAELSRVRSLLQDGEIRLDYQDALGSFQTVYAQANREMISDRPDAPLLIGQNELEAFASDSSNRRRLIDLRAGIKLRDTSGDEAANLTRSLFDLRFRVSELEESSAIASQIRREIVSLEQKEQILARDASERLDNTQHEVRVLDEHYAALASRITLLTQRIESVEEWWRRATGLRDSISAYADEASDGLDDVANALVQSSERLADNLESHARTLRSDQEDLDQRLQLLRHEIQPLRDRLDRASAGLGATTAELRTLRANEADLQGMLATLPRLRKEQERVQALRDELMRSRQIRREERARRRADAAADVQDMLGPRVQVTVRQFSDSRSIKYLMDSMLRGSGLRYSTISETLANSFLPEQLINLVERGDAKTAAALSGMPTDRIARVLSMLNEPEFLSALCEADLEDDVDFLLADHGQLKSIENLSTGQKCATLLPVLLTDMDRCLILDQPEDHLDTTYLIETVVRQMARRSKVGAQTIVITHNPNIPVLGEAELVVRLQSDGHRARIESEGVFSDPLVAKGILQLMEGGREAFSRRAAFYKASI